MPKKINHILLFALQIITYLFTVMLSILDFLLLIIEIGIMTNIWGIRNELLSNIPNLKNTSMIPIYIQSLIAIAVVFCFICISIYLGKIINNIKREKYFTIKNLKNIRYIIYSIMGFIFLNLSSKFLNTIKIYDRLNQNFSSVFISWPSILVYMFLLFIIYIIYLVFKKGLELQKDSDSFI